MMPSKVLFDQGKFTEYFSQLKSLVATSATSSDEESKLSPEGGSAQDLSIEVSCPRMYLLNLATVNFKTKFIRFFS